MDVVHEMCVNGEARIAQSLVRQPCSRYVRGKKKHVYHAYNMMVQRGKRQYAHVPHRSHILCTAVMPLPCAW
jgi:hypothetical protein